MRLELFFNRVWYGRSYLRWLLLPLSLIYRLIIFLRRCMYKVGLLSVTKLPVPVIVVGNVTIGGTGKTPFCVSLCDHLKSKGLKPGLISRGYGGKSQRWPQVVSATSNPVYVGDESVLLAKRTNCPMVVGPNRVEAARVLLDKFDCDVVISDDGLQHYSLGRDVDIVLLDARRGLGNGLCLPAGPLREPKSRLSTVDFVVNNDSSDMRICPAELRNILTNSKVTIEEIKCYSNICAMAGIGNPERFFATLESLGLVFEKVIFPDHCYYKAEDIRNIKADVIVMTEKDAVKVAEFQDARCCYLAIDADLSNDLLVNIVSKISPNSSHYE